MAQLAILGCHNLSDNAEIWGYPSSLEHGKRVVRKLDTYNDLSADGKENLIKELSVEGYAPFAGQEIIDWRDTEIESVRMVRINDPEDEEPEYIRLLKMMLQMSGYSCVLRNGNLGGGETWAFVKPDDLSTITISNEPLCEEEIWQILGIEFDDIVKELNDMGFTDDEAKQEIKEETESYYKAMASIIREREVK